MAAAYRSTLFWFRRDLRDTDNAGLYYALRASERVHCAFVFDRDILATLASRRDRRVEFIFESVAELRQGLRSAGGDLVVLHDRAVTAIPELARRLGVDAVFANGDYEPDAIARDDAVEKSLAQDGRRMHRAKDQVIFEKDEVVTRAGRPFTVFTPYRNAWMAKLEPFYLEASLPIAAGMSGARALLQDFAPRMKDYREARNFPAVKGVSYLSVHNRFGTVSIRELARRAKSQESEGAATWLAELAWRDFFFQVLWHHPRAATHAFRAEYDALPWPNDPALFEAGAPAAPATPW